MRTEKGDAARRGRGADLKHIGDIDRLVKRDLQGRSGHVLSFNLPLGDGDQHELGKHRFQVTAIGGMAGELVKVSLVELQQGERGVGQKQVPGEVRR